MLIKMRHTWRMIWSKNHASPIALLPKLSASEQTKLSWAVPVTSYAAVPRAFQGFFEPLLAVGMEFPYTVLTPSCEGFIHRTTEKLICVLGHEIHVLERSGSTFTTVCYPLEGISCVEVRTILLDSCIRISGVTRQGVPAASTLRFSAVTDHLVSPIVEKMRLGMVTPKDAARSSELAKFDPWIRVSLKFMNYAKRSLLEGETVLHATLQPEIRAKVLTVLGKTYHRTISPAHATILTDRELILIREEPKQAGRDHYGGIWEYIPLDKIAALSLSGRDGKVLALSIRLPEGADLEALFPASAKGELDQLLDRFRALAKR